MATLWERIKAYLSGWPIGKDKPEPEPEPKKKKSAKQPLKNYLHNNLEIVLLRQFK